MEITTATLADLDALADIEAACFPAAEAAAREEIEERLRVYADHFYIAREKGALSPPCAVRMGRSWAAT